MAIKNNSSLLLPLLMVFALIFMPVISVTKHKIKNYEKSSKYVHSIVIAQWNAVIHAYVRGTSKGYVYKMLMVLVLSVAA
ncbi:unnamed protein product [Thlaspi arvense]|uniref:Uncharacterized protein n=1 Tax=Thlaspi arvense TaxID=13288 RepID=A0AAU9RVW7_THLAR|nr:unnamed protein product [Thlaspi arvense]